VQLNPGAVLDLMCSVQLEVEACSAQVGPCWDRISRCRKGDRGVVLLQYLPASSPCIKTKRLQVFECVSSYTLGKVVCNLSGFVC
jgi:hypothetical protein